MAKNKQNGMSEQQKRDTLISMLRAAGFEIEILDVAPDYLVAARGDLEHVIVDAVMAAFQATDATGRRPRERDIAMFASNAVDISINGQKLLPCEINFTSGRVTERT